MKASIVVAALLLTMTTTSCQTAKQSLICGTAMFSEMLADQAAQASPYVLCENEADSDLVLRVSAEIPQLAARSEAVFFFRKKTAEEKVSPRQRTLNLTRADSRFPVGGIDLTIQGEELWLLFRLHWGKRSPELTGANTLGFRATYAQDFTRNEGGMHVTGSWQRKESSE